MVGAPRARRRRFSESGTTLLVTLTAMLLFISGCTSTKQTLAERATAAKNLFDQTTKTYHLPSAEAKEPERSKLLKQAAAGYKQLLRQYPDQTHWSSQALRSLGNIRVAQGRLDEAVRLYARVEAEYPAEDWEIIQARKSAADLLWEANRHAEAKNIYQKIVDQFDTSGAPAIFKSIVRGAKTRLKEIE